VARKEIQLTIGEKSGLNMHCSTVTCPEPKLRPMKALYIGGERLGGC